MAGPETFNPAVLKPSMKTSGGDLKPSLVTSAYSGGTPGAGDLKPSLLKPDGDLKESLLSGGSLKPSLTSGTDSDAVAYFAAVEGAGGSFDLTAINAAYTPTYIKNAISAFVAGLKSDGAWSLLDEYYLFCAKDWDGRLVKLKGSGLLSSTGYTSSHWTAAGSGTGLQGGGSRTISSGFIPSSSEDISMGGYITALTTSTGTYYVGQGAPAVGGQAVGFTSPSSFRIYRSGASVSTTGGHQVGSFCYTRRAATDHAFYSRGASIWTDNTATLDAEAEFRVGQFFSLYHNGKLATSWIGRGISGSVANAISNREQTLLTAIGGNAY